MFKIQGAKNDVRRVPLLSEKYNILQKRREKNTKVTLKVHDMKKERFNMFQITCFPWHNVHRQRR